MATVTAEILVNASTRAAYRAFTNSTSMREWLCDVATVEARPKGRMYLWWRGDFYSSGHYLALEENKCVTFRWYSSIDPAPTEVTVGITEKDGGVLVRMDHTIPEDQSWANKGETFRENWTESLENLKSVLETGIDLRIATRPMLGIAPGDFTAEQAAALGIPVREGLRLDGLVPGMGAERAGLQKDDVLVGMAGKEITSDFNTLPLAIAGKKGGDEIEVVFYRGPERKTVTMELSKRPMVDVPFNAAELVKQARALIEPALAELETCFAGSTDEQARKRPDPKEWSALEVVAHLIQNERANSIFLASVMDGNEAQFDGGGNNITAQVEATVAANPTVRLMLDELRRSVEEVLMFAGLIPDDFIANNRGSYYRFGSIILQPNFHLGSHTQQIKDALEKAAR